MRKFKGGEKRSPDEALCKLRYQTISITPLADIANASATRILQTAASTSTSQQLYTMTFQVGTSDFSGALSLTMSCMLCLCMLLFLGLF